MEPEEKFDQWAIMEIMGYRKLGGKVSEYKIAGAPFIRIDIPKKEGGEFTQIYNPTSVYCLTPTTEAIARAFAYSHEPEPVQKWDLVQLPEKVSPGRNDEEWADDE